MRARELAHNLAVSLANSAWDRVSVAAVLCRRLPPFFKDADALAAGLVGSFRQVYAPSARQIAGELRLMEEFRKLVLGCRKHNVWPDPVIDPPIMQPCPAFAGLELPRLPTPSDLAEWLAISDAELARFTDIFNLQNSDDETAVNHYFWHLRPKRNGGVRLIEAPKQSLKSIQRKVLRGILQQVPVHGAAFGFVQGRNCLQGAQRHCGEQMVISMDLKDFFPSVPASRIHALFRCLGYPHAVAQALTGLVTLSTPERVLEKLPPKMRPVFRASHLPQGAPTSPALANLCAFRLDRRLAGLAGRLEANYSRYADDISFSGDGRIKATVLRAVREIVPDEGFTLNEDKTRVQMQGTRQVVTGLVVNERISTGRAQFDLLKAVLHRCAMPDDTRLLHPSFRAEMDGKIAWVEQVNPVKGLKLRSKFEAALSVR